MASIVLALTLLLGSPCVALQQEGWAETTFHRVHLHNGNFIDGRLISDKPNEVILLLKVGELAIRRDQIHQVEFVKVKSYNEKPIILAAPKSPTGTDSGRKPGTPPPVVQAPEVVRKRVDAMLFKMRTAPAGDQSLPLDELTALGEEAIVYLASRAPGHEVKVLDAIAAALIQLKPTPKAVEVLDALVTNQAAPVRAMAGTVLVVTGGEPARAKYLRPLLADSDAKVREAALGLLGTTDDREWFELMGDLCGDPVKEVRLRAMRTARAIATKNSLQDRFIRVMAGQLTNPDAGVRADAAAMIGALNNKEAWSHLVSSLSDPESFVRAAAAQAMMTLAHPESANDILSAISRETDRSVRIFLAGAAQKMRLQKAIEPMIQWLGDPQEDVRKVAAGTLKALTGEDLGTDQAKWMAWFQTRPR